MRAVCCALFACAMLLTGFRPALGQAVGGGYTEGGLVGEYFSNPSWQGTPAFTRREVRIHFDWGTVLPVGGSTTEAYRTFPHDNFSVRWSGQLIPRFSEAYTFIAELAVGDDVRVKLKGAGETTWREIIANKERARSAAGTPVTLNAGQRYDMQISYWHRTDAAACTLRWASPSTPDEVIDPVAMQGLNLATYHGMCFANRAKDADYGFPGAKTIDEAADANGDPTRDVMFCLCGFDGNSGTNNKGTWLVQFHGKAQLTCGGASGVFQVGDQRYKDTLPRGTGYDPASNTTTFRLAITVDSGFFLYQNRRAAMAAIRRCRTAPVSPT